jgi:hypothetical protein
MHAPTSSSLIVIIHTCKGLCASAAGEYFKPSSLINISSSYVTIFLASIYSRNLPILSSLPKPRTPQTNTNGPEERKMAMTVEVICTRVVRWECEESENTSLGLRCRGLTPDSTFVLLSNQMRNTGPGCEGEITGESGRNDSSAR